MPYFIEADNPDCSGWATVKDDGEVMGCHATKADAVDQMVALSIAEDVEPGGERAATAPVELRQVDLNVPAYIRVAAQRGLDYHAEGLSGDGVTPGTIREARAMARGDITEDKVIRANAWAARHAVDLEASKNSDPDDDEWPGAGAVAHFLWGINPLDPVPAWDWFARKAEQIADEEDDDNSDSDDSDDDDSDDDNDVARSLTISRVAGRIPTRTDGGAAMTMTDRGAGRQIRHFNLTDFEFRDDGATGFRFEGVASVVDAPYSVRDQWGEYTETIRSGAFNKTLRDSKADVALFVNHNVAGVPLATRGAGTLSLSADPNLRVGADLDPARPDVQVIRSAVTRGEMSQMSIGFFVPKARDKWNDDRTERTISEVQLVETSIVWRGANPLTSGSMRSVDQFMESLTDIEMSEDEVRRAIAALELRLPAIEAETTAGEIVVTDDLRTLWDQRATPTAWL